MIARKELRLQGLKLVSVGSRLTGLASESWKNIEEEINSCDILEMYWAYCAIKPDVWVGQRLPFYDHRKRGMPSGRVDIRAG